jgi:hypothetical protein
MKTFIWVVVVVISQYRIACAQGIGGIFKNIFVGEGSNAVREVVHTASERTVQKLLSSLGPDTNALKEGNVRVLEGNEWKPAATVTDLVGRAYIVRAPASETARSKALTSGKIVLNEKVVQAGTMGNLALEVIQSPLPWNPVDREYSTDVRIGLEVEGKKTVKLDAPITINLTGNNVTVKPDAVKISKLGQDGFVSTKVSCGRHDTSAKVILHSDLGDRSFDILIGPHVSQLKIAASEKRIFGYGLGTAVLSIKRIAEDGKELSDSNVLTVNLMADRGKLDASLVTIPSGLSHSEVKLRSVGLGATTISAESDSYKGELSDVQFIFPISYILAALAGGCLGGLGKYFRDVKASRKKSRKPCARYMGEGCLVGFLIVAAVAAGVVIAHLPTTVVGTELGALVIATAGGYVGAPMLDRLAVVLKGPATS